MDGDGDVDLMSASEYVDKVAWYENTAGDGTAWTAHTISTAALCAWSVYAADVDGELDGYEYISADGTEIVDDDLDTFTRVDAQTISGSDEPEDVSLGDNFTFREESTLFDSETAENVGTEITEGTFTVVEEETVTVPAGTFHCLRIDLELEMSITERGITDTMTTIGSVWFDVENGFGLRWTGTADMTMNEFGLTATATLERVLVDYEIGGVAQLQYTNANSICHLVGPATQTAVLLPHFV